MASDGSAQDPINAAYLEQAAEFTDAAFRYVNDVGAWTEHVGWLNAYDLNERVAADIAASVIDTAGSDEPSIPANALRVAAMFLEGVADAVCPDDPRTHHESS
jgi:hypothetical protein